MLSYLLRQSRTILILAVAAGLISGICSVLLLTQINIGINAEQVTSKLIWTFGLLAFAAMVTRTAAAILFERLSHGTSAKIRCYISQKVLATSYQNIEQIGGPRIQSALTDHGNNVAQLFIAVPLIVTNGVIVIGCLIYMAYLSLPIFLMAVGTIALGGLSYHLAHLRALSYLEGASKDQDKLFNGFRSLIEGAKELRLNADKRKRFYDDLLDNTIERVRKQRTTGMSIFAVSASWGSFLIFLFIGLVLFVLVGDVPDRKEIITGFALVFVYMVTPLEMVLNNLPKTNLANVSAQKIDEITNALPEEKAANGAIAEQAFKSLVLNDIAHRYYHEVSDDMFTLGPVSLNFKPGQISFLVGGNGSGKTTLAKLIAGLYEPESGFILFNGIKIDKSNYDDYRQFFSAVFSDFHLFENLLDTPDSSFDEQGNTLLDKLHLTHKVQVKNGAFTTRALSQGQRKRLALVSVYLEQRAFLIFDEWAADQDPVFKEIFYREVLPELRQQGKSVLVISHDDRYFDEADQLIRIEDGKIISVTHKETEVETVNKEHESSEITQINSSHSAHA